MLMSEFYFSDSQKLNALRKAADSISQGDIVERTIRTTGSWGLLNEQVGFFTFDTAEKKSWNDFL